MATGSTTGGLARSERGEAAAADGDAHHEAVMSGHGYYNEHSVPQAAAAELGLAELELAAAAVPLPVAPQPVVVADYGCSQGRNSLRPMGVAVRALRRRTAAAISVVHTDLPANDFSALFEVVVHDPASYVVGDPNVFASAAGRSFYEQVVPPGSVALGWSSTTTHWLSDVPAPAPGHLSPQASTDRAVLDRFAAQAARDWEAFLAARAAELAVGGRLVMVEPCAGPDGATGTETVMAAMDEAMASLVDDGLVDAAVAASCSFPVWMRTPEEHVLPAEAHPALRVVSVQVVETFPGPLWARYEQDGDAAAFVDESIGSMRAWSEAMLAEAVTEPAVLDEFYERCRAIGMADPGCLNQRLCHLVLDLERV